MCGNSVYHVCVGVCVLCTVCCGHVVCVTTTTIGRQKSSSGGVGSCVKVTTGASALGQKTSTRREVFVPRKGTPCSSSLGRGEREEIEGNSVT